MPLARRLSVIALAVGLSMIGYAAVQGDVSVHLVVVIPVVSGTGPWAALGGLATIGGLVGLSLSGMKVGPTRPSSGEIGTSGPDHARPEDGPEQGSAEASTRTGGVILLGPIPIAWGSDRSSLVWAVVLGVVLTVLAVGLMLYLGP